MTKKGPILIAEDDPEDQEVLKEVFSSLGIKNQLRFFENGKELLNYLLTTTEQPFLIISDVNLPGMNGHEVKKRINENVMLRVKSIPFIFLTTTVDPTVLENAYLLMVQGYFQKENTIEGITKQIRNIMEYWISCKHPNSHPY